MTIADLATGFLVHSARGSMRAQIYPSYRIAVLPAVPEDLSPASRADDLQLDKHQRV